MKAPASAPFFLPTSVSLRPHFVAPPAAGDVTRDVAAERIKNKLLGLTEFGEVLLECGSRGEFAKAVSLLREMGATEVDAELRSLDVACSTGSDEDLCGSERRPLLLLYFLMAMDQALATRKDFELIVSYLALCLRIHTQVILGDADLRKACARVSAMLQATWSDVDSKFNLSLAVLNYLRSLVV